MDELVPNTEGCTGFEVHPFKKGKCKQCGRPWQEHRGIISEELVQGYLKEKRAVEERRQAEEEEARKKKEAQQKAKAKKKQKRTEEDDWLYDGGQDGESDDADLGFRMFEGGDLKSAPAISSRTAPAQPQAARQVRVVNLIDFGECDVPEEPPAPPPAAAAPPPPQPPLEVDSGAISSFVPSSLPSSAVAPAAARPSDVALRPEHPEEDLLAEIEHLRQRLEDSAVERDVQVSIVQDEVAEKQRLIEELQLQRQESEARLEQALEQVEALRQEKAAVARKLEDLALQREETEASLARERGRVEALGREQAAARIKLEEKEPLRSYQPLDPNRQARETQVSEVTLERQTSESSAPWKLLDHRNWLRCLRPSAT